MSKKKVLEVDKVYDFYHRYVQGNGIKSGWATLEDAYNSYWEASGCVAQPWDAFGSILDVGSGQGHFLPFLRQERNFTGHYTGIELLDFLHQDAIDVYGKMSDASFINDEFLSHDFGSECFDWVVSLGSFSIKQANQKEYDFAFCQKMIGLANYGVSVFLNDIDFMRPGRLEELPDLAAHDIGDFVSMVETNFKVSRIEVKHYPDEQSQPTMIHIIL